MMTQIKIECGCGQHYAFDVEPVNGLMPARVACPVCGADGTDNANVLLAQSLPARPNIAAGPAPRMPTAPSVADAIKKLKWYEQAWIGLPILLVFAGGAVGGACGGGAWACNKKVFLATKNPILRYVWTGLISLWAVIVYFIVVTVFFALIK